MAYIDSSYILAKSFDDSLKANTALHANLCEIATIDIDSICGYHRALAGMNKFPRIDRNEESIPEAVKIATLSQVEYLYSNQPDSVHGVRADDENTATRQFSPRAVEILIRGGYTKRCGKIIFDEHYGDNDIL